MYDCYQLVDETGIFISYDTNFPACVLVSFSTEQSGESLCIYKPTFVGCRNIIKYPTSFIIDILEMEINSLAELEHSFVFCTSQEGDNHPGIHCKVNIMFYLQGLVRLSTYVVDC